MSSDELLLIGAGGHAGACVDVIQQSGSYRIAGLIVPPGDTQSHYLDQPVLGTDDDLCELSQHYSLALVTVGQILSCGIRRRLFHGALALGFGFPVVTSPHAYVSSHAMIGAGSIVMHQALINANATVGHNCIVNSGALVEHDASIGDHCHVSTKAIVNGQVNIGSGSFIGSGSIIREGITVGSNVVVGMGLSVRRDLPDNTRYLG